MIVGEQMKHFIKTYFVSIFAVLMVLLMVSGIYIFLNKEHFAFAGIKDTINSFSKYSDLELSDIERAQKYSSRTNILIIGKEHQRTDTIMFLSYDEKEKKANVISIPRDTYYKREGYKSTSANKINAIYQSEGIVGLMSAVEDILGLDIDNYVEIDYNALVSIVNAVGGVDVYIPVDMNYDDPYDNPPLSIHFEKGDAHLDGQDALRFLRFRKNNDGVGYPDGDLGRIRTQQAFVQNLIDKCISLKIVDVVTSCFAYVETDISLIDAVELASGLIGFSSDNVEMTTMDCYGKYIDGLSFVVPNERSIKKYVYDMYGIYYEDSIIVNNEE